MLKTHTAHVVSGSQEETQGFESQAHILGHFGYQGLIPGGELPQGVCPSASCGVM
jgi:hypothetical protein